MRSSIRRWLAAAVIVFGLVSLASAKELATGDTVPAFSAPDQFGNNYTFAPGPKFLFLAFDMNASKIANTKLTPLGDAGLQKLGIIYVMDIHSMPAIGRYFALPKMRKYTFHVVLAESADLLTPFPRQPEKITVLTLTKDGTIQAIHYWNPQAEELGNVTQ